MDIWTYSEGRLPYRFDGFPYKSEQCLDGMWQFVYYPKGAPVPESEAQLRAAAKLAGQIPVPSNWQLEGYGIPRYINTRYTFGENANLLVPPTIPQGEQTVGIYYRSVVLDAIGEGERILLSVGGFSASLTVWVNGVYIGYADNGRTACQMDITDAVQPGENHFTLKVDEFSPGSYLECQDMWRMSGIFRSVKLYRICDIHLLDTYVWSTLEQEQAKVHLECKLHNFSPALCDRFEVRAVLVDSDGKEIAQTDIYTGSSSDRFDEQSFERVQGPVKRSAAWLKAAWQVPSGVTATAYGNMTVSQPKLWTAETPNLYTLRLKTFYKDRELEQTELSIGIRTFAIDERGRFLVNGKSVKLRGVNRHEFDPQRGYCVDRESMVRDIEMMKRCNINAVRSSHYPNDPAWYALCDQYGLYVMDEANMETHGLSYRKNILPGNDLRWLPRVLDRQGAMLQTNKNHACIFCWSLGNEIGFGETVALAAAYCRTADPTRLVHKRQMNSVADMDSETYPAPAVMVARAKEKPNRAFLTNEYSHAMGNACGNLAEYWDAIYAHDNLIGGFVWEWCDHGLEKTDENGRKFYAYGGDFGEAFHDSNFCIDGLTTPDRQFTAKLQEVQKLYEPLSIQAVNAQNGVFRVENRCGHLDLSVFELQAELMDNGTVIWRETQPLPPCPPGEWVEIRVSLPKRPPAAGERMLLLRATEKKENGMSAWGQFLLSRNVQPPAISAGEVKTCSTELQANGRMLKLDPKTGALSMGLGEKTVFRDLRFTAYRAPVDNDTRGPCVLGEDSWKAHHLDRLTRSCVAADVESIGDGGKRLTGRFRYAARDGAFDLKLAAEMFGDGSIFFDCEVIPEGRFPSLARMGLELELPREFGELSWYGKGPLETYPDRQRGGIVGCYRENVFCQQGYIKPQEYGLRQSCRSMVLTSTDASVRIEGACKLAMGAVPYSDMELAAARHPHELPESDCVYLHIDYAHRGLGNSSCGPDVLSSYRVEAKPIRFGFLLTAAKERLPVTAGCDSPAEPYENWVAMMEDGTEEKPYRDPSDPDQRARAGMI